MLHSQTITVNLPDFMIVGAAKSGTTFLHDVLSTHPDIFMPKTKETWFFHLKDNPNRTILNYAPQVATTWLEYLALFEEAPSKAVSGEATPSYLYYHHLAIPNIRAYLPNPDELKIIIILREPIAKAWSHYRFVHTLRLDPENLDFPTSLMSEHDRIHRLDLLPDLHYVNNTLYADAVEAYQNAFTNVRVYRYDDLRSDPRALLQDICAFIGVSPERLPELPTKPSNASRPRLRPRGALTAMITERFGPALRAITPDIATPVLKRCAFREERLERNDEIFLAKQFKPDVERLQQLIDLDLTPWLNRYKELLQGELL